MVIENVKGNYGFIRGGGPFSSGCVARPGFEIVHAPLRPFVSLARGFELVEGYLKELDRPIDALCAMHLRIPQPLTMNGFEEFNRPYVERLHSWGLEVYGANPVARTNVEMHSMSGDLVIDMGSGRKTGERELIGRIGAGGAKLRLRSFSGDLKITQ